MIVCHVQRAYLEFLLRYESEQAFDRDVQILDAKEDLLRSAEDDEVQLCVLLVKHIYSA